MAGVTGFEPIQTVLETGVLPLTPYPHLISLFSISQKHLVINNY